MRILVTGGSGLVGTALKEISKKYIGCEFNFLSSKMCDLTNLKQTEELFEKFKPTYVIHLAARVGGLYKNMNERIKMLEENITINTNVIKCCDKYNVRKLISCLSTCIFPDKVKYPISENDLHNGPPHDSNSSYAYAKRLLDIHSKAYRDEKDKNFICIIPTNIYGKNDNFSLEDGHVIPALIHRCFISKKNGEPFSVKGTGKPLRQFIYSEDLARLIMWCLLIYIEKKNIILSPNTEISIGEVAEKIAEIFDYKDKMVFLTNYADGQFKKTVDNSYLMNEITKRNNNFNFTSIEEGLKLTIDWFKKNYKYCRK
tara:strand:- start:3856 stop:4797 length:942 start_codon:yes stop_codon:yes gene_type:complete